MPAAAAASAGVVGQNQRRRRRRIRSRSGHERNAAVGGRRSAASGFAFSVMLALLRPGRAGIRTRRKQHEIHPNISIYERLNEFIASKIQA